MVRKGLGCIGHSNPHFASSGGTELVPISGTTQTALRQDAFCEPKLCWGKQPQPRCGFAQESNACLVVNSPSDPCRAKEGLGCLRLRGPCCLAGGLRGLKPIPNIFSFAGKADLAGKGLVCTGPSNPPFASSGGTQIGPISDSAQTALREAAFCQSKLCSAKQPQPQCGFAQESNGCLILT